MNENWLLWGGGLAAASAVIATTWRYLLMVWNYLCAVLIVKAEYRGHTGSAVLIYMTKKAWLAPAGITIKYSARSEYLKLLQAYRQLPYEMFPTSMRIGIIGKAPFSMSLAVGGDGELSVNVISFRGIFNRDKVVVEAMKMEHVRITEEENQEVFDSSDYQVVRRYGTANRARVRMDPNRGVSSQGAVFSGGGGETPIRSPDSLIEYFKELRRYVGWSSDDIGVGDEEEQDPFERVAMSAEAEEFVARIERWIRMRRWYEERGVPWKMGACLYGPPGNGKTAFVHALAQKYGFTVFAVDITSMTNEELQDVWEEASHYSRAIMLLEDFDSHFKGREPKNPNMLLTFDSLLNAIDGIVRSQGLLTIITTNDPTCLDPALGAVGTATRPGRIDFMLEFKPPSEAGMRKMAGRILKNYENAIDDVVREGLDNQVSGAQFELMCLNKAYELARQNTGTARVEKA